MALEEAPPFWWRKAGPMAWLFSPFSLVWGLATTRRMNLQPTASVAVPVLCVGNFIAGGAGKTPTAMALARAAIRRGMKPGILSRGYGGRIAVATLVDPAHHRAIDTGDEPLLLAQAAKTVVSANRPAGARLLVEQGCDIVIMDDGFQNPALAKDFSIIVVDAKRGIGNGFTIPAGPMRAPLSAQLALAGAVLVIGEAPGADRVIRETARRAKPWFLAHTRVARAASWKRRKFVAFAGIADPSKFFDSLESTGAQILARRPFPDHHHFTQEEARDLLEKARSAGAELVTTAKDKVRFSAARDDLAVLAAETKVLEIKIEFDDPRATDLILDRTIANAEKRFVAESVRASARR